MKALDDFLALKLERPFDAIDHHPDALHLKLRDHGGEQGDDFRDGHILRVNHLLDRAADLPTQKLEAFWRALVFHLADQERIILRQEAGDKGAQRILRPAFGLLVCLWIAADIRQDGLRAGIIDRAHHLLNDLVLTLPLEWDRRNTLYGQPVWLLPIRRAQCLQPKPDGCFPRPAAAKQHQ